MQCCTYIQKTDLQLLQRCLVFLRLLLGGGGPLLCCLCLLLGGFERRLPLRKRSLHAGCDAL